MSFAAFSWPWVLAGLAALAAALFVLQILRIRYREVRVVSTMLWRRAMQDAPVRKFSQRFKHPLAYLLLLAICSLIWLALAEPQPKRAEDGRFYVLVLDGSAGMAAAGRYERAVEALMEQVGALPAQRRQVIWSGADVRTLLNPGEDPLLLERRLKSLAPQSAPATVERLLGELAATRRGEQSTEVLIFGAAPVRSAVLESLPEHMNVMRAYQVEPLVDNAGIVALGASDAQSGSWDRVDVFVQVQSVDGADIPAQLLSLQLDGAPLTASLTAAPGQKNAWLIEDLPAQGGLLTVRLERDDQLPLDDSASLRLPNKPYINVLLSESLDASLRAVLEADPAVRLSDSGAQLVIRRQGEALGVDLPALEFVGSAEQQPAFLLTYPQDINGEDHFAQAVEAIGLKQIDAMSLAEAAARPIEVTMQPGAQWKLSLWQELLSEEYNFTRSRAFPLFVANAVRWLAGIPSSYPFVAAGRPLVADAPERALPVLDAQGRSLDTLGVPFVPEQAGELSLAGSSPLAVSLLDSLTTAGEGAESVLPVAGGTASGGFGGSHWVTVLLLLALILSALEWYGYRKGRMP